LSAKFDVLRPSLLPGLVDSVAHNLRHGRRDVGLFEIGSRFSVAGGESRTVDFFDGKGVVELLCSALTLVPAFETVRRPYLVPGQSATVTVAGEDVGI